MSNETPREPTSKTTMQFGNRRIEVTQFPEGNDLVVSVFTDDTLCGSVSGSVGGDLTAFCMVYRGLHYTLRPNGGGPVVDVDDTEYGGRYRVASISLPVKTNKRPTLAE
jgi:hypothetical protein